MIAWFDTHVEVPGIAKKTHAFARGGCNNENLKAIRPCLSCLRVDRSLILQCYTWRMLGSTAVGFAILD